VTALTHLDPFTLLRSPADDTVLSFRHRLCASAHGNFQGNATPFADALCKRVDDGELEVVTDPDVKPSIRTCLECGCTDEFACDGGCAWVGVLLCSTCAGDSMRSRQEIEADVSTLFPGGRVEDPQCGLKLARVQLEVLLDIRDILMHGAIASEGALESLGEHRIITAGADLLR
jgi:hypothetical protein